MATIADDNLFWVDLEMTGLYPDTDSLGPLLGPK